VAKSVQPNALALAEDPDFIQGRVKDSLHDFVRAERPVAVVNEDKFVIVVLEVRLKLRLKSLVIGIVFSDSSVFVVATWPCQIPWRT
jgi:hypothetical protein